MSKSLKNYITIREYLNAGWSSAPVVDLRLYFLQHKYSSTLHFSVARIEEASSFRRRITLLLEGVAEVMRTTTEVVRKPSSESRLLHENLCRTRDEVNCALADDFNTPQAMRLLAQLVTAGLSYVDISRKQRCHPPEPLLATRGYVLSLLELFGVPTSSLTTLTDDKVGRGNSNQPRALTELRLNRR